MASKYPYEEYHKEIDGVLYKRCATHNHYFNKEGWFPCNTDYFYRTNRGEVVRLSPNCKKCSSLKNGEYQKANIEKILKYQREVVIPNNKKKISKRRKLWKENTKEKRKEYRDKYMKDNPEKFKGYHDNRKAKNHTISNDEWESCKQYFNHRCAYCGLPIEEHYHTRMEISKLGDFHKEHVVFDGKDDLSNCIPSCKNCNSQKWKYEFQDWYDCNNDNYSKERYDKIIQWMTHDYKKYIAVIAS